MRPRTAAAVETTSAGGPLQPREGWQPWPKTSRNHTRTALRSESDAEFGVSPSGAFIDSHRERAEKSAR